MERPTSDGNTLTADAPPATPRPAEWLPLVYDQLKQLARRHMANERWDHTLQPTALVHEAYLKLVAVGNGHWETKAQFFHAAAQSMRRILVDHARAHGNLKRGGGRKRLPSDLLEFAAAENAGEMLALDEALSRLEGVSPAAGEVVRLRFFAGLTIDEVAEAVGTSPRSVKRDWTFARAWLGRELGGGA